MRTVLSLALFMVSVTASASAMTMDEAVQEALKNNIDLQAARQEEIAAQGRLEQASLILGSNPVIEGTSFKKTLPADEGGDQFRDYELRLSQEFEIAGQRGLRKDAAEKGLEKT